MTLSRLLFLLPLVAMACSRPSPAPTAAEPERDASGTQAEDAAPKVEPLSIGSDALGPIRLGMSRAEIEALETLSFTPTELDLEGQKTPALRATRDGKTIGTVELENDRASRIRVDSSEPTTAKGAHVGMTAKELGALLGPGKVLTGEGNVCAVFDDAPGLSFCFQNASPDVKSFSELVESEATVREILVVGRGD